MTSTNPQREALLGEVKAIQQRYAASSNPNERKELEARYAVIDRQLTDLQVGNHAFSNAKAATDSSTGIETDRKCCPYCAELINAAAIKCRYCGENLDTFDNEFSSIKSNPSGTRSNSDDKGTLRKKDLSGALLKNQKMLLLLCTVVVIGLAFFGAIHYLTGEQSSVEGKLLDPLGFPVVGATITAVQQKPIDGYEQVEAKTAGDGSFKLSGLFPSSRYTIEVWSDKWESDLELNIDTAPNGITTTLPGPIKIERAVTKSTGSQVKSLATGETRFKISSDGIIHDSHSGIEWIVGPDRDTSYGQAMQWLSESYVGGGGWSLPTGVAVQLLIDDDLGYKNLDPVFKTDGWKIWVREGSGESILWQYDLHDRKSHIVNPNDSTNCRVFGIRLKETNVNGSNSMTEQHVKLAEEERSTNPDQVISVPNLEGSSKPLVISFIPSGEFVMGCAEDRENGFGEVGPMHKVRISRPFWLGTYEVTVDQFRAFIQATNYQTTLERGISLTGHAIGENPATWQYPGFTQSGSDPVVCISFEDATAFCKWLSLVTNDKWQLPTEAQWEYACRAGSVTNFFWGRGVETGEGMLNGADQSALETADAHRKNLFPFNDGYAYTSPVGSFRPNNWGLFDMSGNAYEWCQDWYLIPYYKSSPVVDPVNTDQKDPSIPVRVVRGGAWNMPAEYTRSGDRGGYKAVLESFDVASGFRVMREI
jgi:sulfatase modifying factor 1